MRDAMPDACFARDSLSNLAASLNAGKDKAAGDAFFVYDLDRPQIDAMYRGDWLARKVVDIVPYDMVREWRQWSGHRAAVRAAEAAERRFGLRKVVQRALTLGRLYGGGAILVGTGESDPAGLMRELDPERIRPGDIAFLHAVSRWQLGTQGLNRNPLDPWCGEPEAYEIMAPGRGTLAIHPSRVLRFLGNEWPDPNIGASPWSDSVLQTLYDAVHSVALTTTGATSLMHEAKVDIVTVPNLSEHLSSAATTDQLSARFAYAAAMKSLNNLLLLGDGESWSRQKIDFAGLPEMVRTFLQVAAGAADIPVTRLLGQSPAGMSATGESDTRNYYDMIAARREIDLRPKLERLDEVILRSAGLDPAALTFAFKPLWQMDAAASATIALQKAQATQIYAGLNLWPASVTAALVRSQLVEDGTYPGAETLFVDAPAPASRPTTDFDPAQPRDPDGRWTNGAGRSEAVSAGNGEISGGSVVPTLAVGVVEPGAGEELKRPDSETIGRSPDGEPIEAAAFRGKHGHEAAKAIATLLGAVARFIQRWRPQEPDDPDPAPALHTGVDPSPHPPAPSSQSDPDLDHRYEPSPPGLIIKVTGNTPKQRGDSYAQGIRDYYGASQPEPSNVGGGMNPDGIIGKMALEAKYTDDWSDSHYNPSLEKGYPNDSVQEILKQAEKYSNAFPAGVRWFTNSRELADFYSGIFRKAGIKNFTFTVVPATR